MLGLSTAQIRSYATQGFLTPELAADGELRFGFQDLILLRTAGELASANIPQRKVRRVLERLRDQLPAGRSLTGVRIAADGDRVVVRDGEAVWNPESGQSLFDFAVADIAAKTAPFALRAVEQAREREETLRADDWFDLACELELSSIEEAKEAYERALKLDPRHPDAHVNLGRLLHEQGAPAAAEEHYRKAIAAKPDHDTAWFNLGVALEDLGHVRDATEAYRRAIALDDNNADAHYNLAGLCEKKGDKQAALRHLKTYARLRKS